MDIGSGYRARMSSFSERAGVSDVAGLIDRSTELFPGVAPSTGALWLLATRAGRITEAGRVVAETAMATLLRRFEDRLGASFSVAQAITTAAASAQYAVALDND